MRNLNSVKCLVIGSGAMGQAHLKVCKELLKENVFCYAPSDKNKKTIQDLGISFFSGSFLETLKQVLPTHVIIATPVEVLSKTTEQCIEFGIPNILVEKPAFLEASQGKKIQELASKQGAQVFVAYNRRFYQSVLKARELIQNGDEIFKNVFFEFTEWSHEIVKLSTIAPEVKARWVLANSMHVIDLAFSPIGLPDLSVSTFLQDGSLDWHPCASTMAGAGKSKKGVLFSYTASWASPGRWAIEWITNQTRYIFRPLESLKTQSIGSVAVTEVVLENELDIQFKPGVYLQDRSFFENMSRPSFHPKSHLSLVPLAFALELTVLADQIAGYSKGV